MVGSGLKTSAIHVSERVGGRTGLKTCTMWVRERVGDRIRAEDFGCGRGLVIETGLKTRTVWVRERVGVLEIRVMRVRVRVGDKIRADGHVTRVGVGG